MKKEQKQKTPYRLMVSTTKEDIENIEKLDFILSITNAYEDRSLYINKLIADEVAKHKDLVKKFYEIKKMATTK